MATDTAALVVALSAQVTKFEKDMQGAVTIADKHVKIIEGRFTAANKEIGNQLSGLASGYASNIGALGSVITRLGPAGLTAAAGLGAAVGTLFAMSEAATQFAERARRLRDASETIGLSATQLKALGEAGTRAGLDFEETTTFFTQFIRRLEELRKTGSGPLYDSLLKIDVGLLRQLSTTKDSAEAINILAAAYNRLTVASERLQLSTAAGGRGGATGGRLLGNIANAGGVGALEAQVPKIDTQELNRIANLGVEIDELGKKIKNTWASMFSGSVLEGQKRSLQLMLDLAKATKEVVDAKTSSGSIFELFGRFAINTLLVPRGRPQFEPPSQQSREPRATFDQRFGGFPLTDQQNVPLPRGRPEAADADSAGSLAVQLSLLRERNALLGDAATQLEHRLQKEKELAVAIERNPELNGVAKRAMDAFVLSQKAAALATLERLSVATQDEIVQVRLAQLEQDRVRQGLTRNQVDQATVVILREAKQAADALTVRRAYLPGLTQLAQDSQNLRKQLDELSVNSLNNLTDGITNFITGAKSAKEAFSDMAKSILTDLTKMIVRMEITGPLAAAIGGAFNPGGVAAAAIPKFAGGGVMDHDGLAVLHANETVFTPKQLQALTTGLRSTGGSNSNYAPVYNIDARGSQMTEGQFRTILNEHGRNLMQTIERRAPANMANNRLLYA